MEVRRRGFFGLLAAAPAALTAGEPSTALQGIAASASEIRPPEPAVYAFEHPGTLSEEMRVNIGKYAEAAFKKRGVPIPVILVLDEGVAMRRVG